MPKHKGSKNTPDDIDKEDGKTVVTLSGPVGILALGALSVVGYMIVYPFLKKKDGSPFRLGGSGQPNYRPGSIIEKEDSAGPIRVVVTAKEQTIKNGMPGFDGYKEKDGTPIWGYDSQIIRVIKY